MNVKQWVNDFLKEEDGLTTVEYAVAGGVVAAAVVSAFTDLGEQVKTVIGDITKEIGGSTETTL